MQRKSPQATRQDKDNLLAHKTLAVHVGANFHLPFNFW